VAGLSLMCAACGPALRYGPPTRNTFPGDPVFEQEGPPPGWRQRGLASYYGKKFHGRTTANGEVYDMYGISAAHRNLPFGTRVRVRRLESGRTIDVRINDRGPFIEGRIIDLSYGAAEALGMVRDGVVAVEIEVLSR